MILIHTINTVGSWDSAQQIQVLQSLKDKDVLIRDYRRAATENLQGMAQSLQRIAEVETRERQLQKALLEVYDAWRCEEGALSPETMKLINAVMDIPSKKV